MAKEPEDIVIDEMPEGTVDPQEPELSGEDPGTKAKPAPKTKDELAEIRKELEQLRKTNKELDENARYWAEQARGRGKPEPEPDEEDEPEEPEDDDEPEIRESDAEKDVYDLSKEGLVAAAVKRGLLTRKQAKEILQKQTQKLLGQLRKEMRAEIAAERSKMSRDAELVGQYPDLQNSESELFQETQKLYQAAVKKDPEARKSLLTLELCAQAARAKLDARKPARDEEDRLSRVRAQAGDRGRRRAVDFEDEENSLPPQAREIIAAIGVTEQDYRANMPRRNGGRG